MTNPYAPPPSQPGSQPEQARDARRERRTAFRDDPRAEPQAHDRPAAPPPTPPSPEVVRATTRRVLASTGVTTAALLSTALPLPWQAAGAVLSLLAVLLGVRALRAVRRAGLRRPLMPVVVAGLAVACLYLVSSLGVLATWPLQTQRQECLDRALTLAARDSCEADFREGIQRFGSGQ